MTKKEKKKEKSSPETSTWNVNTYYNRLDCDTLDTANLRIVNRVQFFQCLLDIDIRPSQVCTLVQIVEIIELTADELCK